MIQKMGISLQRCTVLHDTKSLSFKTRRCSLIMTLASKDSRGNSSIRLTGSIVLYGKLIENKPYNASAIVVYGCQSGVSVHSLWFVPALWQQIECWTARWHHCMMTSGSMLKSRSSLPRRTSSSRAVSSVNASFRSLVLISGWPFSFTMMSPSLIPPLEFTSVIAITLFHFW